MTNTPPQREGRSSPWEDLVVSILAVNQYSLERTYALLQDLRDHRITDPVVLAHEEARTIEKRLSAGGCDRGPFMTKLFAERLAALGTLIQSKGVAECERIIGSRDTRAIEEFLMPVKGIGPVVLRNFFMLRGLSS